jgi:hypothetical protein
MVFEDEDEIYRIGITPMTDARKSAVSFKLKKSTIATIIACAAVVLIGLLAATVFFAFDSTGAQARIETLEEVNGTLSGWAILNRPAPTATIPAVSDDMDGVAAADMIQDEANDTYIQTLEADTHDAAMKEALNIPGVKVNGTTLINGRIELVGWFDGASEIYAKGTHAVVIDLMTGKSFNVRRFGGWWHGDSEPLSKEDTAIMKEIYGGHWSWNRRPIVLKIGERYLAASMNGMPHMADPTPGNGFPGHFCIHFKDSKVHATGKMCARHQACVMEAFKYGNLAIR